MADLKDYYERRAACNPNDSFSEGMKNSILLREDLAKQYAMRDFTRLLSPSDVKQDRP